MRRLLSLLLLSCAAGWAGGDAVLVLPFFNLSKDSNLDWIGESISETVRDSLAGENVGVVSRETRQEAFRRLSIRPYAPLTRATVIKIGQALDASKVISGDFVLTPPDQSPSASRGSLRITGRIVDLKNMGKVPEFVEIGALEDLAALVRHFAWQSLRLLIPKAAPAEDAFHQKWPLIRVDAIENYIRGLLATSPEIRHRFFTQAARLDANYSPPVFELGHTYFHSEDYRLCAAWLERMKASDPRYLEARFMLGVSRFYLGDYRSAEAAFREVAASIALSEVLNNLGAAQFRMGMPEALTSFRLAISGDDTEPDYYFNLGYAQWKAGDFDGAEKGFRSVLERDSDDEEAKTLLARSLQKRGPKLSDVALEGLERLKLSYEEANNRPWKTEPERRR